MQGEVALCKPHLPAGHSWQTWGKVCVGGIAGGIEGRPGWDQGGQTCKGVKSDSAQGEKY